MARGFFPLDAELALAPCDLAPGLHESLVRLSTWIPSFAHAAREVRHFTGATVSEATGRRLTEAAGAAYVQVQAHQARRLEREPSMPPAGPLVQHLSVDGAMVPLVGGEWAEVKTLVVGALTGQAPGEAVQTTDLSYFSRLTDADSFTAAALVETHRRGTQTAAVVVAVNDGAVWEQGFVDSHRVDAVRVLDFCHAASYLVSAAQAVEGAGTPGCAAWVERQRHELRHGDPDTVVAAPRDLQVRAHGEARAVVGASLAYLEKRREQIRYAEFELLGRPIGSGVVESANKLLVEERLKGAWMHWARRHVTPLLALRTVAFNDRWAEAWPQIVAHLRQARAQDASARRMARRAVEEPLVAQPAQEAPGAANMVADRGGREPVMPQRPAPPRPGQPARPAANHPWRRARFGRPPPPQLITTAA